MAKFLLDLDFSPNIGIGYEWGNVDIDEILFISNDEIMQADFPLSIAIKHHNVEMVKLLLSHGADLDCCIVIDEEYQARLQYICTHYNSPSVEVPYRDMIYIAKKYGTPEILALIKSKRDKE